MLDLVETLLNNLDQRREFVYCRLVETRGSTPQKAGATMLVYPDGSQTGTLGGGCVEAEVKRLALAVESDTPQIASFQLDHDYGWDDGLICGGRMQVLVQRLRPGVAVAAYYRQLAEQIREDRPCTECVVFDSNDEWSGLSVLFDENGQRLAATSEAVPEEFLQKMTQSLRPVTSRPRAYVAQSISYLPILKRCRLLIVGGGHVGKAVADLAHQLDFDVWVVDDRETIVSEERFPMAGRRIAGDIPTVLPEIPLDQDTYCLIVTRGHNHDEEALFHLIDRGAGYVGLIGSRRKIKLIFEDLRNEGVSDASLESVYAPLGIDIGSQTVPEIAVSICAELVAHRNCEGRVPGRPEPIIVNDE